MSKPALKKSKPANAKADKKSSKRMSPEERENLIIKEAVLFFAEHGFEGKTRDLAARLGITQPLLYRYFPSKDHLIERVYQEVYVRRWNVKWEELIADRTLSLEERLCRFYKEYSKAVYDYVWVRIFVYSGLKGVDINDRYLAMLRTKVLIPIAKELRHTHGIDPENTVPISEDEIELVWGLHAAFFYRGVRHFVYNIPMVPDPDQAIDNDVHVFLKGAPSVHEKIFKSL